MVSAGGAGLGRAIAKAFADAGARVHVCDIAEGALAELRASSPAIGTARADAARPEDVASWFGIALGFLGGLDVLVNNVGIAGPTAPLEAIAVEDWDRTLAVNLRSFYLAARHAIPPLRAAGGGTIINMSSVAGRLGYPLRTPYAASKWAVIGLTQSLAIELGPARIRVNALLPGVVAGERTDRATAAKAAARGVAFERMEAEILAQVSLGRMVEPADVAAMALFLASPAGRSITGQSLSICAGLRSFG